MKLAADIWVVAVAALHLWFLILEMFLWRTPLGLKTFRNTPAKAEATAVLAANQGLYNGFLAAGLCVSFFTGRELAFAFRVFFLACVVVAGIYGGLTAARKILWVQALPAVLGLGCVLASGG